MFLSHTQTSELFKLGTCKKNRKKRTGITLVLSRLSIFHMFQVVVVVSNPFQKQTQRIKHRIFLQNLRFMQIYLTPPIQKLPGHSFFTSFAFHPKPFLEKRPPSTGARSPATAHLYAGKNYVAENPIPIYKTITMNTTVTTNLQLLQLLEQYLKKSSLLGHVRAVSSFHIFLHVVF